MASAEYNIADDKIRFYPDSRLPQDEYEAIKKLGFAWHGSIGAFVAKWAPSREDHLASTYGLSLDYTEEQDDAEARAERFEGHAANAQRRSDDAYAGVKRIADFIPFGQPILVGHHSEKRARRDQERIDSGMRRTIDEQEKAAYWQRRAERAVANAAYKERPDVIHRRIQGLEADERKFQREVTATHTSHYFREVSEDSRRWAQRWLDHTRMRLDYERALYEASGGIPADQQDFALEKGGAVRTRFGWHEVIRVNKKTVTVASIVGGSWTDKIELSAIKESRGAAEWATLKAAKQSA
jgi:hypothetical protein